MMRLLYRFLLRLHPPAFRRRFAEGMLWIFDETAQQGTTWLLTDGLISLMRQWVLRSGVWKLPAAGAGGLLTLAFGLVLQRLLLQGLGSIQLDSPHAFFVLAAFATLLAISLTLMLCVLWFRFSRRRRA